MMGDQAFVANTCNFLAIKYDCTCSKLFVCSSIYHFNVEVRDPTLNLQVVYTA